MVRSRAPASDPAPRELRLRCVGAYGASRSSRGSGAATGYKSGGDFVEALTHSPWGDQVAVSTFHIESPPGRDLGATRANQLPLSVGRVRAEASRICAGDFNWAASDAAMDVVLDGPPRVADLWELRRAPDAGYTYNGAGAMNANPSTHGADGQYSTIRRPRRCGSLYRKSR